MLTWVTATATLPTTAALATRSRLGVAAMHFRISPPHGPIGGAESPDRSDLRPLRPGALRIRHRSGRQYAAERRIGCAVRADHHCQLTRERHRHRESEHRRGYMHTSGHT
jgi:hypothetical protein